MFLYEKGRIFQNDSEGKMQAEITYKEKGNLYYADHTFVDPSLRGGGLAMKLVDALVELAKENGKKIVPICPYVVELFNRMEAKYSFIWHKGE